MVKCTLCGQKIATTFLGKLVGTQIGSGKSAKYLCSQCQKNHSKEDVVKLVHEK